MELKVENSQFSPNHGGGGGTFYQGRQGNGDGQKDGEQEQAKQEEAAAQHLEGDSCLLPKTRRSNLGLTPVLTFSVGDRPLPGLEIDEDIHRSVRVMNLMLIRLERDFVRRLHSEIGDVIVA
jgi:hypothetical protein